MMKKWCLDHNDLNNYRAVSNFCPIAKILEKHVLTQVSSNLNSHHLYNTFQSAYRPGHCTETVILKVVNDLFLSLDKGNMSVRALFDYSSAFGTIDQSILAHRLHTDIGFTDTVLQWLSYYLTDRTQSLYLIVVLFLLLCTQVFLMVQFLAPYFSSIVLSLCRSLLIHTKSHTIHLQVTSNYRCLLLLFRSMQQCIRDIIAWSTASMFNHNDNKTELMLVTSKRTKHQHNLPTSISIGNV